MRLLLDRLVVRAAAAAAAAAVLTAAPSAHAETQLFPMYCVPGVTSARCRGTFWESGGTLYKKEDQGMFLQPVQYTAALGRLRELDSVLKDLRSAADAGEVETVGAAAAKARIEIRQVGENVVRSLAGDERIDNEKRLFAVVRALDDADIFSLRTDGGNGGGSAPVAPGFSPLSILLDRATQRLDEFLRDVPLEPDEYAA